MQLMLLAVVSVLLLLNGYANAEAYYTTSAGGIGALYTTSDGVPNRVLVHRVLANGKISFVRAVNTGGNGSNLLILDALASQGSVQVHKNYLFTVNAGSNSLSMFVICPWDATQIKLISVKPTYGTYPVSVAVNDKYACAVTSGNVTGVRCYTYNSKGLSIVSSLDRDTTSFVKQTLPPTFPFDTIGQIIFSADNRALIISVVLPNINSTGYLLFFLFNSEKTQLSAHAIKRVPPGAFGLVGMITIGTNGLLVTEAAINGVFTMKYSSTTGAISDIKYTPVFGDQTSLLCWVVYSPTIRNYFVSAPVRSAIAELNVTLTSTTNSVSIVKEYPIVNTTGVLEMAMVTISGKDYLYVIGTKRHGISAFEVKGVGKLTPYTFAVSETGNTSAIPELEGLAYYLQIRSSYNQYSRCRPAKSCFAKRDSYFDCY